MKNDDALSKAIALHRSGDLAQAEAIYRTLLASHPNHPSALNLLGTLYCQRGQSEEGVKLIEQALTLKPDYADAHVDYGVALLQLGRYAAARASFEKALTFKPDNAELFNFLGKAYFQEGRRDEGIHWMERAIALKPNYVNAHYDHGVALLHTGKYADALVSFERATVLELQYNEAWWNISLIKLLLGDYKVGWELYEWRWKRKGQPYQPRLFDRPLWLGKEPLAGKTILLHAEQGFGDTVQWCRYVPMVEALGAKVVFEVQPPLQTLISTVKGSYELVVRGSSLPAFDYHCPLSSLPLALGTTLDTIPADVPYLAVSPEKRAAWQALLGTKTKPRIGLVWSGSHTNVNDRNRSIAPELLLPLLEKNFEYHSLQKDLKPQDREFLKSHPKLVSHSERLSDFADTAALIEQMDVIITVDTAVAHLAGALGKRVWILIPFLPDFRWMIKREDSLWYPTAHLFRQPQIDDWESVVEKVKNTLRQTNL